MHASTLFVFTDAAKKNHVVDAEYTDDEFKLRKNQQTYNVMLLYNIVQFPPFDSPVVFSPSNTFFWGRRRRYPIIIAAL